MSVMLPSGKLSVERAEYETETEKSAKCTQSTFCESVEAFQSDQKPGQVQLDQGSRRRGSPCAQASPARQRRCSGCVEEKGTCRGNGKTGTKGSSGCQRK